MVVKNFKFMENYNSWKMYVLASQNIDSKYLYSYAIRPPCPPNPPIDSAVTTFPQVLSSTLW